ncbi:12551_t:CDS:10 [Ambispora gerdemannii]|uniref:12551_t:CDS:1 n=1 Tax=Ambispora gerdemannii TaxID=144530 RepID=A0A9N8VLR6_9GLOM|nr:12551_t:CDS:10 [Ambispora gerdemannii]
MSKLTPLETVYALHTFQAENPDEVPFEAGEPIVVLEKDDMFGDGWWQAIIHSFRGQNIHGQVGLFPRNYTSYEKPASTYFASRPTTMASYTEQNNNYQNQNPQLRSGAGVLRAYSPTNTISTISTLTTITNGQGNAVLSRPASQSPSPTPSDTIPNINNNNSDGLIPHNLVVNDDNDSDDDDVINNENLGSGESIDDRPPSHSIGHFNDKSSTSLTSPSNNNDTTTDDALLVSRTSGGSSKSNVTGNSSRSNSPRIVRQSSPLPEHQQVKEQITDDQQNETDFSRKMSTTSILSSSSSNYDVKSNHRTSAIDDDVEGNYRASVIGDHPSNWDVEKVCSWLHEKGFDSLMHQFIENDITGDVLLELTLVTLKELNIMSFGKRVKIMSAIADLKTQYKIVEEPDSQSDPMQRSQSLLSNRRVESQITVSSNKPVTHKTIAVAGSHTNNNVHNQKMKNQLQQHERLYREEEVRRQHNERIQKEAQERREQDQNSRQHQQQEDAGEEQSTPRPPSPRALTNSLYNTPVYQKSRNTSTVFSEHSEYNMNKATYSIIPEMPLQVEDHSRYNSVYTNTFNGPNGNNKARAKILSRLGYFKQNGNNMGSPGSQLMRSPSTRGWDFLLAEEEDAIKELERIEREAESQKRELHLKNKYSNSSRALVKVENSRRKFHTSAPVPPKKNLVDRNSHVGSQLGLPPGAKRSMEFGSSELRPAPSITNTSRSISGDGNLDDEILASIGIPDHEGWLKKQGEKYKTWKTRFCILKGVYLFYLKSDKIGSLGPRDPRIKGRINLSGYKIIPDENIYPGKYGFRAVHETGRMYLFAHDDAEKTKEWMKAMMKATITRDMTAPVISSCNIQTVPLPVAQKMNPRPSFTRPSSVSSEYQNNAARNNLSSPLPPHPPYPHNISPKSSHSQLIQQFPMPHPSHQPLTALIYQSSDVNAPPIAATDGSINGSIMSSSSSLHMQPPPPHPHPIHSRGTSVI